MKLHLLVNDHTTRANALCNPWSQYGDIIYFIGAVFYVLDALRDDGWCVSYTDSRGLPKPRRQATSRFYCLMPTRIAQVLLYAIGGPPWLGVCASQSSCGWR